MKGYTRGVFVNTLAHDIPSVTNPHELAEGWLAYMSPSFYVRAQSWQESANGQCSEHGSYARRIINGGNNNRTDLHRAGHLPNTALGSRATTAWRLCCM